MKIIRKDDEVKIVVSIAEASKDGGIKRYFAEKGPFSRRKAVENGILTEEEANSQPIVEWIDKGQGIGHRDFSHLGDSLWERYNATFLSVEIEG